MAGTWLRQGAGLRLGNRFAAEIPSEEFKTCKRENILAENWIVNVSY
jgi:hypothetical protein